MKRISGKKIKYFSKKISGEFSFVRRKKKIFFSCVNSLHLNFTGRKITSHTESKMPFFQININTISEEFLFYLRFSIFYLVSLWNRMGNNAWRFFFLPCLSGKKIISCRIFFFEKELLNFSGEFSFPWDLYLHFTFCFTIMSASSYDWGRNISR